MPGCWRAGGEGSPAPPLATPDDDDLPPEAFVLDPVFGRRVTVPDRAIETVAAKHPEIGAISRRLLLAVVRGAEVHVGDRKRVNRHLYYRGGVGPTRWLLVIVEYDGEEGEAFNAFGVRRLPTRARRGEG